MERVSYDVLTPSAARGILEAVHWKPSIRWIIERIHVLKPIRFESIRRNEVGHKISERAARVAMKTDLTDGLVRCAALRRLLSPTFPIGEIAVVGVAAVS